MKRILSILAAIAVVACSKTETTYDQTGDTEIVVAPVATMITRAAIADGVYPEANHIALFAFHSPYVKAGNVTNYALFNNSYLYDTEYYYTGVEQSTRIWAGLNSSYYWPITGSLVFAGYSLQAPETAGTASPQIGESVTYDLVSDLMKIDGYVQSASPATSFDLLYFGRSSASYNNRRTGDPISLDFKHALSWITISVKGGSGALIDGRKWTVTDVRLEDVHTTGDFTYDGLSTPSVDWEVPSEVTSLPANPSDIVVYTGTPKVLTGSMTVIENTENGTLVIPQAAKNLKVTIAYKSPAGADIEEEIDIDLSDYTPTWIAGKRYTYELTFDPQEIKVAPIVETWPGSITTSWPQ